MIASHYTSQYLWLNNSREKAFINKEIIESFPNIPFSIAVLQTPPCILFLLRVEFSISIDPSHFQEIIEAFSFFWSEAWLLIGEGSEMNVDLIMANIKIPA